MVDDTRLELVTSRTSSGCATSCANRPFIGNGYCTRCRWICQHFFAFSPWLKLKKAVFPAAAAQAAGQRHSNRKQAEMRTSFISW